MKNVHTSIEGTTLTITVDLATTHGPTKSGKGLTIASTEGYRSMPLIKGVGFNLHVYSKGTNETNA